MKNRSAPMVSALILLLAASGCVSEPATRVVDFANVGDRQSGANFNLHVRVVGIENGSVPIPDAFVGVANGAEAIAKARTGADGSAVLGIKRDQTVTVVAKAHGWTTEDSGSIRIGSPESTSTTCFMIFVEHGCVVTISNETSVYHLDGKEGRVTIVVFRRDVEQQFPVAVTPHANLRLTSVPDSKTWFGGTKSLSDEREIHALHMLRLVDVTATLSWRNNLQEQGDFELGVGCQPQSPQARTYNDVPSLTQQSSTMKLQLPWKPTGKSNFWWTPCTDVYAGPITDTVNSQITTQVGLKMVFEGRSTIIPIE